MKIQACYIIRPNNKLMEKLQSCNSDDAILLVEPTIWSKWEGGRTIWTSSEYTMQVKLLFLSHLYWTYMKDGDNGFEIQEILNVIMGVPPFGIDVFDIWWIIERFNGIDESFEDIEKRLDVDDMSLLKPPGVFLIDDWLSTIIKDKNNRSSEQE